MADILLTHSYHLYYDGKQVKKMQPYPPLGTLYAAALLRESGYSVAVFDTMLSDPDKEFSEVLKRERPRVVVVYEDNFNFLSKMCLTRMRQVAYSILEQSLRAGALVLINGSDASDCAYECLKSGFLCVLLGEAEVTLLETVRALAQKDPRSITGIPGIAYLDSAGQLVRTPARPVLRDLAQLPPPARDLIDIQPYREAWRRAHGFFSLNLISSRGCPYRCNWCAKPIYGNSFVLRSPMDVAREMRALKYDYGAEHLWFADDIFGLRSKWVQDFALAVEKLESAIPFKIQSRVDLINPAVAHALKRAGCREVWMGVESGSQKILDAMDKGTRVEEIVKARESLGDEGIKACYFIQFGYPGEDWEAIQQTIELVRLTRPDDVGVSVSYPLPGTKFFERVREQLGSKRNWSDSGDISMMFQGPYTDQFYRALHDYLHAQVDSWTSSPGAGNRESTDPYLATLWDRIVELETTSRNANATLAPNVASERLVQLSPNKAASIC
ncbi:MAG: B12-binding domain-containing radical SAM protein [Acidobacteria bacterium]|nr:B12-binding domain-containing radical SAM protein [Acidobacteriota bacterium]